MDAPVSLSSLLAHYRQTALTECEESTYFEELIRIYFVAKDTRSTSWPARATQASFTPSGANSVSALTDSEYRVTKMKLVVEGDKTTGKPALERVMKPVRLGLLTKTTA